jgi:hypothetical protein
MKSWDLELGRVDLICFDSLENLIKVFNVGFSFVVVVVWFCLIN